jgi:hypothetical protein
VASSSGSILSQPDQPIPVKGKKSSNPLQEPFGGLSKSLRDYEYEEARKEIGKIFDGVEACCKKIDGIVLELNGVLAASVILEKRMTSLWATKDLRLSQRLRMGRVLQTVGVASQKLALVTRTIRMVASIMREDVDQTITLPEPGFR